MLIKLIPEAALRERARGPWGLLWAAGVLWGVKGPWRSGTRSSAGPEEAQSRATHTATPHSRSRRAARILTRQCERFSVSLRQSLCAKHEHKRAAAALHPPRHRLPLPSRCSSVAARICVCVCAGEMLGYSWVKYQTHISIIPAAASSIFPHPRLSGGARFTTPTL